MRIRNLQLKANRTTSDASEYQVIPELGPCWVVGVGRRFYHWHNEPLQWREIALTDVRGYRREAENSISWDKRDVITLIVFGKDADCFWLDDEVKFTNLRLVRRAMMELRVDWKREPKTTWQIKHDLIKVMA